MNASLKAYKGEKYAEINEALRTQSLSTTEIESHIKNIDASMKKGKKNVIVYRGIPNIESYFRFDEGDMPILVDLAFCSVTTDLNVTHGFTQDGCCVVTFTLTTDLGRYVYDEDETESEILIQRNTQLLIENNPYHKNGLKIYPAIIKPYIPPVITKKDIDQLNDLKEELFIEEWMDEIKEDAELFEKKIEENDIDEFVEMKNKTLHIPSHTIRKIKETIKSGLLSFGKNIKNKNIKKNKKNKKKKSIKNKNIRNNK